MRHIWTVVCRYAVEDRDSRNISLIETLSQVTFKGEISDERPVTFPFSHRVISLWRVSNKHNDQERVVRLRVLTPASVEVHSTEMTVKPIPGGVLKTVFHSGSFSYVSDGIYEYEISFRLDDRWVSVTQVPLYVTHGSTE